LVDNLGGDYQEGILRGAIAEAVTRDVNIVAVVGGALKSPFPADFALTEIYERAKHAPLDGVIIGAGCVGTHCGAEYLQQFAQGFSHLPACSIGVQLPSVPSLVISNHEGMKTVVEHLIEGHSCRKIAYIRGPAASAEADDRLEGYRAALESHRIPFDPGLVREGNFMAQGGNDAMQYWLEHGIALDAVAAANDYMALGAIEVLKRSNVRIPHEILVAGFDDVPLSRVSSPSLTTVRQPVDLLGRLALDVIMRQLDGETVPACQKTNVELLARQSCGCAYRVLQARSSIPPMSARRTALNELELHRDDVLRLIIEGAIDTIEEGDWPAQLLDALRDEILGVSGSFLLELEKILAGAKKQNALIDDLSSAIGILRAHFRSAPLETGKEHALEDLWHAAVLLLGAASTRTQVQLRIGYELAFEELQRGVERLSTALSESTLADAMRHVLPAHGIGSSCISLYEDSTLSSLRCIYAEQPGVELGNVAEPFHSGQLAPSSFFPSDRRWTYLLMALTFGTESLGVILLEFGPLGSVYKMLRTQIGSALKGASLHRDVVRQTRLRERAEREQLQKETLIAQQLQTAILPRVMQVPGFELAALMIPAADVGGDYYDVLPLERGCWIGIGDVAGHGLLAGLEMLMIQSMVAGMVAQNPIACPKDVVISLNRALYENVRHRLQRDEHATLTILRASIDGELTFAGCHEDFFIYRVATGLCQQVPTPGFWVAAVPDLAALTVDSTEYLEPGDILVLYSDGVTEARNHLHEQFGIGRLRKVIEASHTLSVREICAGVIEAVRAWAPSQDDDMTVFVGRFLGDGMTLRSEAQTASTAGSGSVSHE
jgi:DNA-binding LacI/PurR family transcriptional regulator/serine phosphatase RsbU (regulator of sigma subunit)